MNGFHFSLTGNLAHDPKFGVTDGGTTYANLTVMRTDRVKRGGEWQDGRTLAIRLTVWGDAVDELPELGKGDLVVVEVGSDLHQTTYEGRAYLQASCRSIALKRRSRRARQADEAGAADNPQVVPVTGGRTTRSGDTQAA